MEKVNHPAHYNQIPGIECIDVVEHFDFNLGNVIKYVWRAGLKDSENELDDLQKALWYLEREIGRLVRERTRVSDENKAMALALLEEYMEERE